MTSKYNEIRHRDESGQEYWLARELATAIAYKDFRNFKGIVEKARKLCKDNNANEADHFVECTEMVEGETVLQTGFLTK